MGFVQSPLVALALRGQLPLNSENVGTVSDFHSYNEIYLYLFFSSYITLYPQNADPYVNLTEIRK